MAAELKPTTAAEYRKGKTKLVKLLSGNVFEIRKMPVPVMAEVMSRLGLDVPQGTPIEKIEELMKQKIDEPGFKVKVIDVVTYTVPRCVIQPKITEEATENTLAIDDVSPDDLFELFGEIFEFTGVSKAAEALRRKFRTKPIR